MAIRRTQVTMVTAGSAGSATASGYTAQAVVGNVLSVHVAYGGSPGTTDIVIQEKNISPALPVLTKSNYATDGWFYPRTGLHAVADGSAVTGPVDYVRVADQLSIAITGSDSAKTIVVTIVWDDLQ